MAALSPPGLNVHVEIADAEAQHYRDQGWVDFDPDLLFHEPGEDEAGDHDGEGPPPRAGRGSSTASWLRYARGAGVAVADDADRASIIAACEAAGVPSGASD